jgi:signal transduction histidine kinase
MTEGQEQQTKNLMDYHHEVLESQIEVQKQAFERIGSELYDNVGQMLSVAKIYLCTLEESALNEEQQNYVKQINEIVGKTIVDLRTLIRNLETYLANNFDLSSSLGVELQRIRKTKKDISELMIIGTPRSLGYEKEIVLFRIVQELITGLLASGASGLQTSLHFTDEQLTIRIQYEGMKVEVEGVKQRTELIGGRCSFVNTPKKEVKIEVPVRS